MIKILITEKDNQFKSLIVKGHANSAPYGHDLVCAAVTAITLGGVGNIQNDDMFDYEVKEGLFKIEAKQLITEHDKVVLETIICSLENIRDNNPDFVTIKKENF